VKAWDQKLGGGKNRGTGKKGTPKTKSSKWLWKTTTRQGGAYSREVSGFNYMRTFWTVEKRFGLRKKSLQE